MPIALGDEIEVPDDDDGWVHVRLVRRGTDEERIEKPAAAGGEPLKVPVWIVEYLAGPHAGQQGVVPNGTIARVIL